MTYSIQLGLNKTKEALAQQCLQESKKAHYKADLEIEWSPAPPKLTFNLGHTQEQAPRNKLRQFRIQEQSMSQTGPIDLYRALWFQHE